MAASTLGTAQDIARPPLPAVRTATAAPWMPDNLDGTYSNPVLHADYSDPDAIRVGADYWMTASSFNHVPGLPLLHSRDLVNWRLVGHALPRQIPEAHFALPRHGEGVWAPALRHHSGRYWIFYPDPDFGLYSIHADDPRGTWSRPHLLKAGAGLIDPCPFWDEDGRAWLVHGWAKSRAGINNRITLHEMTPDGTRLLDAGTVVINGDEIPGWRTVEGPKVYRRGEWYYIFAPAGGVAEGYQAVFRSRSITGPYEHRIVLEQGSTPVNGPHQGAWVDTPSGEHWFLHFQELPAHGRVVHLQPMRWRDDGWPVMGLDADQDGTGEPVLVHPKPALPPQPPCVPATSDSFPHGRPGLQWQWQGNPGEHWLAPADAGSIALAPVPAPSVHSLWMAPNLLMQKFPAPEFGAEVLLELPAEAAPGTRAGLMVFGYDYAWIGLRVREDGSHELVQVANSRADRGGEETVAETILWTAGRSVRLLVRIERDLSCRFSFDASEPGETPSLAGVGKPFTASSSKWVGAKFGVFCSAAPGAGRAASPAVFSCFLVVP